MLRYHLDLPVEEAAAVLDVSPGAVRMLAQRGRGALAATLGNGPPPNVATATEEDLHAG